jgi:hypothetical protein
MTKLKFLTSVAAISLASITFGYAQAPNTDLQKKNESGASTAAPSNRSDSPLHMNDNRAANDKKDSAGAKSDSANDQGSNRAESDKDKGRSSSTARSNESRSDKADNGANKSSGAVGQSNTPTGNSAASNQSRSGQSSDESHRNAASSNNAASSDKSSEPSQRNASPTESRSNAASSNPAGTAGSGSQNAQSPAPVNRAQSSQEPQGGGSNNTAAKGDAGNASASLNEQQQTRIVDSLSKQRVEPETHINFSVNVGTTIPSSVRLHTLPADIVEITPAYRGDSYFVAEDRIVIVEPSSKRIVAVIPQHGSHHAASSSSSRRIELSKSQQRVIRDRVGVRSERSSSRHAEIHVGDEVPASVTLEEFPETVYQEVPMVRPLRYYRDEQAVVIVDPSEHRVVDVLD